MLMPGKFRRAALRLTHGCFTAAGIHSAAWGFSRATWSIPVADRASGAGMRVALGQTNPTKSASVAGALVLLADGTTRRRTTVRQWEAPGIHERAARRPARARLHDRTRRH